MTVNRREFLAVVSVGIGGTAGCLSPSEGNPRRESTLVVENQRDTEQKIDIRFEDGGIVSFQETFKVAGGEQQQIKDDLSRGATQIDVFIHPHRSQEVIYVDTVPGNMPEYRVTLRSEGVDLVWTEN